MVLPIIIVVLFTLSQAINIPLGNQLVSQFPFTIFADGKLLKPAPCTDVPYYNKTSGDTLTCAEVLSSGKCNETSMLGKCDQTCSRCTPCGLGDNPDVDCVIEKELGLLFTNVHPNSRFTALNIPTSRYKTQTLHKATLDYFN